MYAVMIDESIGPRTPIAQRGWAMKPLRMRMSSIVPRVSWPGCPPTTGSRAVATGSYPPPLVSW